MANYQLKKQVVIKGDQPLAAAGQALFRQVGKKVYFNVKVGEPVAYIKPKVGIPQTIDAAGLTAANVHRVMFAVGHSEAGNNLTDSLRHLGGEDIGNCDLEEITVASPKCGNPSVHEMFFGCPKCDETYTIGVEVKDNFTRSYTKFNKEWALWAVGSYTSHCKTCDNCDTDPDCDAIADGLVESIRLGNAPVVREGEPYPDLVWNTPDLPFAIHKIYNRSLVYCVSFEDPASDCEGCNTLANFNKAVIGGADIDLSAVATPTSDSALYREQLYQVVDIINDAFEADATVNGRAYVTGVGPSNCCPMQIHINTDDAAFELFDNAETPAALTASEDYNPFASGQNGEGYTCGIRVIGAEIKGECDCIVDKPAAQYMRQVRVRALGDANIHGGFEDAVDFKVQNAEPPGGFGEMVRWMEVWHQDLGGDGRVYSGGAQRGTYNNMPRKDDRLRAAPTADCNKDYCSFHIRSRSHHLTPVHEADSFVMSSFIHVESDASNALSSVKGFLDKWATLSMSCVDAPETTCTPLNKSCA